MSDILLKTNQPLLSPAVELLYNDAGWTSYTNDLPLLLEALVHSLVVYSAWDGDQLVGLIRVVGDGRTIVYIQDLLVLKAYKRSGVGTLLFRKVLNRFEQVRQKVLLTDDSPETRGFYEAMGFRSCDDGKIVAFIKNN